MAGLRFRDEIETGNRYAEELQKQGVEAIVVLLHEGGTQAPSAGINDCTGLQGPIVPIAEGFSPAIDVVVSGHTHQAYNCVIAGKTITSASSFGRLVTDIDLQIDPATGNVLTATATNVVVGRDVPADPAETELVERYRTLLGPIAPPVRWARSRALSPGPRNRCSAPWWASRLWATSSPTLSSPPPTRSRAVAAFMNPGGVRADLDAGPVTYEEAFAVQPFNNYLTTVYLTGAQLDCLLEQQFVAERTLQPSASVAYTVDPDWVSGTAADPCSGTRVGALTIAGTPVDPAATYRITVNSFLADGGDGFSVLTQSTNGVVGGLDIDGLAVYLTEVGLVAPPATDRITVS